jgi:hypothetical protein
LWRRAQHSTGRVRAGSGWSFEEDRH